MVGGASIEQIGNTLALAVKLLNVRWAGTGSFDRPSAPDSPQATLVGGGHRPRADRRSPARRSARSNPARTDGVDLERGRVVAEAAVEIAVPPLARAELAGPDDALQGEAGLDEGS